MIIEFQITLNEWMEWKRKNLSPLRLFLLKVAETLWLPLSLLLALSVILVSLRFVKAAPTISSEVPEWLPIAVVALLALARIYLSLFPKLRTPALKKEWQSEVADLKCKIQLTENGFDYVSGASTYKPTWPEVTSVFQTKQLLMFCDDGEYALLIPKRAFTSKKQLEEFLELAYEKTVLERNDCC